MLPILHHRRPPSSPLFQAQSTLWKPVASPQGSSMQLPHAPEVPAQLVDEGSPQTHTNRVQPPIAVSRQPVAPPNPQQQFGTGIRLVDSPSQQQQPSIFGSSNPRQPQQTQPSVFGIQLTNSLQVQPTLPVNQTNTTATATTAANASTGGCSGIQMRVRR